MPQSLEPSPFKAFGPLSTYLKSLPEYASWGQGLAKTPENLWHEIQQGESTMTQSGVRKVRVVVGELSQSPSGETRLLELEQTLADGRKRVRSARPMAEKIIGSEAPLTALKRGLYEELGLNPGDFELVNPQPVVSSIVRLSTSYPGIMSYYDRYIFRVVTSALPGHDFAITEPDGIRSATWGWRNPAFGE